MLSKGWTHQMSLETELPKPPKQLTQARQRFLLDHFNKSSGFPKVLANQQAPEPYPCRLRAFESSLQRWEPIDQNLNSKRIAHGEDIRLCSWNLHYANPAAALEAMQHLCEDDVTNTIVLLQAADKIPLDVLLSDEWVQKTFKASNIGPPPLVKPRIVNYAYVHPDVQGTAVSEFTMLMVAKDMPVLECFRIPFLARPGQDLLVLDLPTSQASTPPADSQERVLRICTGSFDTTRYPDRMRKNEVPNVHSLAQAVYNGNASQGRWITSNIMCSTVAESSRVKRNRRTPTKIQEDSPLRLDVPKLRPLQYVAEGPSSMDRDFVRGFSLRYTGQLEPRPAFEKEIPTENTVARVIVKWRSNARKDEEDLITMSLKGYDRSLVTRKGKSLTSVKLEHLTMPDATPTALDIRHTDHKKLLNVEHGYMMKFQLSGSSVKDEYGDNKHHAGFWPTAKPPYVF